MRRFQNLPRFCSPRFTSSFEQEQPDLVRRKFESLGDLVELGANFGPLLIDDGAERNVGFHLLDATRGLLHERQRCVGGFVALELAQHAFGLILELGREIARVFFAAGLSNRALGQRLVPHRTEILRVVLQIVHHVGDVFVAQPILRCGREGTRREEQRDGQKGKNSQGYALHGDFSWDENASWDRLICNFLLAGRQTKLTFSTIGMLLTVLTLVLKLIFDDLAAHIGRFGASNPKIHSVYPAIVS